MLKKRTTYLHLISTPSVAHDVFECLLVFFVTPLTPAFVACPWFFTLWWVTVKRTLVKMLWLLPAGSRRNVWGEFGGSSAFYNFWRCQDDPALRFVNCVLAFFFSAGIYLLAPWPLNWGGVNLISVAISSLTFAASTISPRHIMFKTNAVFIEQWQLSSMHVHWLIPHFCASFLHGIRSAKLKGQPTESNVYCLWFFYIELSSEMKLN